MLSFARISCYTASLLAVLYAAPAAAEDLGGGFSVNGGATIVSDYRFRGISQTDRRFAIQGTVSVSHASGFYATVWGSSIDDYVANGSDAETGLDCRVQEDASVRRLSMAASSIIITRAREE